MASIINSFDSALPAQHRLRISIDHTQGNCTAYADFDLDSYLYTLKWWYADTPQSTNFTFPRATFQVNYNKKIILEITNTGNDDVEYHRAWTPPFSYSNFKFSWGEDRPCRDGVSGTSGFYDLRYYDGVIYAASAQMDHVDSVVAVYTRDTQANICEDVGLFYSTDGTDPSPCVSNPCFGVSADLTKTLVNYEVITLKTGTLLRLSGRAADTQGDTGSTCQEFCTESISGSGWGNT